MSSLTINSSRGSVTVTSPDRLTWRDVADILIDALALTRWERSSFGDSCVDDEPHECYAPGRYWRRVQHQERVW